MSEFFKKKVWVFDDIIDAKLQDDIQKTFLSLNFPWFFNPDVSYIKNDVQKRPGFSHYFVSKNGDDNSDWHEPLIPIIKNSCKKIGYQYSKIHQGRAFFQLPLNIKDRHIVDSPHLDILDFRHLVILYYVMDSDGDTIIYKNNYGDGKKVPHISELIEKQRITPKKGRVVIFDGYYWHTACQPENNLRCIINYNVS
jgi:hypothetical protein